jgi:pseudouridine kinase
MLESYSISPDAPVLVIGAAGLDIVGRLCEGLQRETSNPAQIRTSFGGVARNVAENLARLGQPVQLLTAVGTDQEGDQLLEQASSAGVDTRAVLHTPDLPTGAYMGILNSRGGLEVALDDMRAMSALTPTYLKEHFDLFKGAALLFLDSNVPKKTLRTAMSLARKARIPVCADPTTASLARRFEPYLERLFMISPNTAEAGVLCGLAVEDARRTQALKAAKWLVSQGVRIAIVTLAEFGVVYATSETSGRVPAIRTEIVDPTGAGDALTAAVIFALLNDIPIDEAVGLGVSAATLTLNHRGSVYPHLTLQKLYDELVI